MKVRVRIGKGEAMVSAETVSGSEVFRVMPLAWYGIRRVKEVRVWGYDGDVRYEEWEVKDEFTWYSEAYDVLAVALLYDDYDGKEHAIIRFLGDRGDLSPAEVPAELRESVEEAEVFLRLQGVRVVVLE